MRIFNMLHRTEKQQENVNTAIALKGICQHLNIWFQRRVRVGTNPRPTYLVSEFPDITRKSVSSFELLYWPRYLSSFSRSEKGSNSRLLRNNLARIQYCNVR